MNMNSEVGIELKELIGMANSSGLYKASDWLMNLLSCLNDVPETMVQETLHLDFQKGDACQVCEVGFIVGGKGVTTHSEGYPCNGYCLMCGQRYNYSE